MSWFDKRASSSISIGLGLLFIIGGIYNLNDRSLRRYERLNGGTSYLLLGAAMAGSGIWTKHSLRLQKQQQERDRLQAVLYALLRQTDTLTVLQFAIAAHVAGEVAKSFLQQQAQVFGAEYEVSDRGDMAYRFRLTPLTPMDSIALPPQVPFDSNVADGDLPFKPSGQLFDVVLFSCPTKQRISAIKAVRDLTGMSFIRAKSLIESAPQPVMQNIPRDLAEAYVQRLERAGAIVTLSSHQK